ncbi:MAG: SURF1 family protein [Pseudomonadota bacterium]
MMLKQFEFRFHWGPSLSLILVLPLLTGLGMWQLDRAEQKRDLSRLQWERSTLPPQPLAGLVSDAVALRFRKLTARGVFEADQQIYIENRRENGRNGFHVITPLRLEGSEVRVLVNRGWIPPAANGEPSAAPVTEDILTVTGDAYTPSAPFLILHDRNEAAHRGEKRWPYLTLERFAARVTYPIEPVVILEDPADPQGFVRHWSHESFNEDMHIGYAIMWFSFALMALAIYGRISWIREGSS